MTDRWVPTTLTRGDTLALASGLHTAVAFLHTEGHGTLFRSVDAGESWHPVSEGLPPDLLITEMFAGEQRLFAGTVGRGIYTTTPDDSRWRPSSTGLLPTATVLSLVAHASIFYAGTERGGVFRSTDGGTHWVSVNAGLPLDGTHLSVWALASGSFGVIASHSFGLHRTTDQGTSWQAVGTDLPAGTLLPLLHATSAGRLFACTPQTLYRSNDGGSSWIVVPTPFGGGQLIRALASNAYALFVGTQGTAESGVYCSTDDGATWTALHYGLPHPAWGINLAATDQTLLVGPGEYGLWRRSLARNPASLSTTPFFSLGQNVPNPFERTTAIPYTLLQDAWVTLGVYDVLGHTVATLLDEDVRAGSYEIPFDASHLPDGFYTYRLTAGNMSQSHQMLILK